MNPKRWAADESLSIDKIRGELRLWDAPCRTQPSNLPVKPACTSEWWTTSHAQAVPEWPGDPHHRKAGEWHRHAGNCADARSNLRSSPARTISRACGHCRSPKRLPRPFTNSACSCGSGIACFEVTLDSLHGTSRNRHLPLFVALASHSKPALLEIDIGQVDADQFADADAAPVEQFQETQGLALSTVARQCRAILLYPAAGSSSLRSLHPAEFSALSASGAARQDSPEARPPAGGI